MRLKKEFNITEKRRIVMTNDTCTYVFGEEYCASPMADSMKIVLVGVAALVAIAVLASVVSFDASGLTGTEFFDGPAFLGQ